MTSAAAVQGFEEYQNKKLIAKEKYYSRKLEIDHEQNARSRKRKKKIFDRIATALENFKKQLNIFKCFMVIFE
jgi:Skp family chaperone for outer membrane proteins